MAKIFTVEVGPVRAGRDVWYHKHLGQRFDCVLSRKACVDGEIRRCYVVIERNNADQRPILPKLVRTIREEDAIVISEEELFWCDAHAYEYDIMN